MTRRTRRHSHLWLAAPLLLGAVALLPAGAEGRGARRPAGPPVSVPRMDVKSWTLENGLEVLFLADHRAPVVTVQVFYHVGSKNETVGQRGVAHMFEHMMFKGSEHVPPEEHARLLKEVGGAVNAFTTEDVTVYHETVPPSYLAFALQLEADRMQWLKLFPETVASEKKVVMEEKRLRIDNDPIQVALERFRAAAYTLHPYRWTAAGVMADLEKVSPADCQRFYDANYVPANATLVIVGDVQEAEARRAVEASFGGIPRRPAPPTVDVREPPQTARRDETLRLEVQLPVVIGGYHMPAARDPDVPVLEVLAAVLSGGESSRLNQRLVRKDRIAVAAGAMTEVMEQPGLFLIYALHLADRDQAVIRGTLLEEVARVRDAPVTAGELEKAKSQLLSGFVLGLASVEGIATQLGTFRYVQGDWKEFLRGAERYQKVTAEDVQRVARRYLVDANLTTMTLQPASDPRAAGGPVP